jgi:hypothetical protein
MSVSYKGEAINYFSQSFISSQVLLMIKFGKIRKIGLSRLKFKLEYSILISSQMLLMIKFGKIRKIGLSSLKFKLEYSILTASE